MAIRIGVGGPPHSGKTVLMGLLRALLPRDRYVIIEGAPDGEGITGWSVEAEQELVQAVRRKGKFLAEFVDWVCDSIRNSTAPITLVDLGGMLLDREGKFAPIGVKLTPQNERMLGECDYVIVIASPAYAEAVPVWISEAHRLGVKSLAILESVLEGADDELFEQGVPMKARITKLNRLHSPLESPTARALARLIDEMAGDAEGTDGSEVADVNFPSLAESFNLPLHAGGVNRIWNPSVALGLLQLVSATMTAKQEVNLWGNCSAGWPYYMLGCELTQRVRYYDPKVSMGYVPIPEVVPQGAGQLLGWQLNYGIGYSFVEFTIPEQIIDVKDLPAVVPPAVSPTAGVVVSGKGPWWLTGTVCRSYARAGAAWVGVFAPQESSRRDALGKIWSERHPGQVPAIVVASCDTTVPVGTVVPFRLPK